MSVGLVVFIVMCLTATILKACVESSAIMASTPPSIALALREQARVIMKAE
jgi:hypothetical protein